MSIAHRVLKVKVMSKANAVCLTSVHDSFIYFIYTGSAAKPQQNNFTCGL